MSVEFNVRDDWAYERYTYMSVDTPRPSGPAAGTSVVTDTGSGSGINNYQRGADGKWRVARDGWATGKALAADSGLGTFRSWARRCARHPYLTTTMPAERP